ncbi:AbrB/MazE/SpoVT family DNA-binding domain-containing protein [Candidatus Bathyarchaeota archaeon]|nr:AbrB/MazE/SpoVT family DNA-binding domain-containing protein [Candidatus Bathyarchaeota archaeon]
MTSKGQITIPKELGERFNLKKGVEVITIPTDNGIIIRPSANPLEQVRGLFSKELELEKAESFIRRMGRRWRLD